MFERFTEKAVKAVLLGQSECRRLGHNHVGTEQILLGIFGEGTNIAYKTLRMANITLKDLRDEVKRMVGPGPGTVETEEGTIPFTPRAKNILEIAIALSKELGDKCVTPVHLLLALMSYENSVTVTILDNLNLDILELRDNLLRNHRLEMNEQTLDDQLDRSLEEELDKNLDELSELSKLETYATNLTQSARENKLDLIYGRDDEIKRIIQILARRKKNNPCLIGEPGVGKTAVTEGLAQYINDGFAPALLSKKVIYSLHISLLLAGTKYRGEFEERIRQVLEVVSKNKNIILVIDEIHTIIGGGSTEGNVDASNILKPALSNGQLQCIGVTTIEEYRKHIEKDKALERRFQPVTIPEPTVEQTIKILNGIKAQYEAHHELEISSEAIRAAATLSQQFIADRFLPDKAIDLMDEACARVRVEAIEPPTSSRALLEQLRIVTEKKLAASRQEKYIEANEWKECVDELSTQIKVLFRQSYSIALPKRKVKEEHIAEILSSWTGIPVNKVSQVENEQLLNIEELLHSRVIGQEIAVTAIARAIRRARVGLKNPNRPIASFIFSGPTGVGKTELTKALASFFFGSEDSMIRLDMSEYMERHTISKLIGSPPGYIGYEEGGFLTEKVRRKPYTVVLFDEVEKAHPDVFNLLLQILEDGRLSDAQGRLIDFKNTLVILTSNIGAKIIEKNALKKKENELDNFLLDEVARNLADYKRMAEGVQVELKEYFRPELLNRLDEIIVFKQLTQNEVRKIADIMIAELCNRIKKQNYILEVSESVKDKLAKEGFDPIYGARPLRRVIMSSLEDKLANFFLEKEIEKNTLVAIDLDEFGNIKLTDTGIKKKSEEEETITRKSLFENIEANVIKKTLTQKKKLEVQEKEEKEKKKEDNTITLDKEANAEIYRQQLLKKRKVKKELKNYENETRISLTEKAEKEANEDHDDDEL
jgi:ATP-dependent Clp protease ATP-binding subunit ClpC